MRSHAAVPIALHLSGNLFWILFSSRDSAGRSHTGHVVVDLTAPTRVLEVAQNPMLSPGAIGAFDDRGAMATWVASFKQTNFLYYIGWNLGVTVPFRNAIGLATLDQHGKAVRYAEGPIIDRSLTDPYFCASCCVIPGEDCWRMWYLSCTKWAVRSGHPKHYYHIKFAKSDDGVHWVREGVVAIDYSSSDEYAISRPSVLRDGAIWKMWYSTRGASYRIGYAESENGCTWERLDHLAGIDVSDSGWDSEMIEYPFVFDHDGDRYMLYNGNDYGRTGFGIAILEVRSKSV